MAQADQKPPALKPGSGSQSKPGSPSYKQNALPKTRREQLEERTQHYTPKAEFWDSLMDSIPPWGDEIAAITLIVFGIVSFLSLLNVASDATLSTAWAKAITSLFGYGSIIVSGGILALGVFILLPKIGLSIKFPAPRLLAIEAAFFAMLAIMHLVAGDTELRAVARAGEGGGYVGWALSFIIGGLFGSTTAIIFYVIVLLISFGAILGITHDQISRMLEKQGDLLQAWGMKLSETPDSKRETRILNEPVMRAAIETANRESEVVEQQLAVLRKLPPLMRIRRPAESLPPSQRPGLASPGVSVPGRTAEPSVLSGIPINTAIPSGAPVMSSASLLSNDDKTHARPIDRPEKPLFTRSEIISGFNAIGTIRGKKTKGVQEVERPDGRIKRYFTVEDMKEPKRVVKRDADLPLMDLLRDVELSAPDEKEINNNVVLIENTLLEFDIDVDVVDVKVGPTVTQYAIQPFREVTGVEGETTFQRTRVAKIASLASDLALSLSAKRLRLETPVPGTNYVGLEVPNKNPSMVALRSVYESRQYYEDFLKKKSPLLVPLGRDVSGAPFSVDLSQMPHTLIAGTTGSGKSVCIAALTTALVLDNKPDMVKLVLLDPKMVELSRFNGLPHLLGPVETDQERIIGVLRWCTREMDRRYKLLEEHAARNIDIFNSRLGRRRQEEYLPYIVILIDEIGDLMLQRPDETEKTITRLAQMARAVGMHLVVATQRPSVDVITGLIKANFPGRISFAVASSVDSRVILDSVGAETLLGRGDMLFLSSDAAGPKRIQGCFVSDDEVRSVVNFWKNWHASQIAEGRMEPIGIGPWERGLTRREFLSETDPMLEEAITLVVNEREASASLIQRRLGIGYPRAARIMDLLEELGVIGAAQQGGRSREVLMKPGKDPFKELIDKRAKGK